MKTPDIARYFVEDDATFTIATTDILNQYGDMRYALLYSTIFFPEFIEVDGSILLKLDEDDNRAKLFSPGKEESTMTLAQREASFNSEEVAYLFRRDHISGDAIEIKLAHIIADAWRDRLGRLYPSRTFSVSVLDPSESGSVYSVEFFEVR
jgi:hypothetical protein